ncbi:MAG: hypothetical protein KCHDKBKB_01049 [Elusimicrobia bacterium]|nr:hypothetical protein [Elusimicrobiota bacterium]
MATLESLLSQQVLGNLAADILAPQPPILGLIQALQFVDGPTPKGKTRITLNWTAPTRNEVIGGELIKNPDNTPDVAEGANGAVHELQFDPVIVGTYSVYERTATSGQQTTLTATVSHGQRIINVNTPVPVDIVPDAFVVIEDGVTGLEEYAEVKSVNTGTGEIVLKNGLFFSHLSGSIIKAVTLSVKTETTEYTIDLPTGVITEVGTSFTAGNRIIVIYQTTLQDLDHYELYRVPGNGTVSIPNLGNVLGASGVQTVDDAIPAVATSYQDQSLIDSDNGKDFTYFLFAVDSQGNTSNLSSEVMTENIHLVFVELISSIVQNLGTEVSSNKVVVSWDAVLDPNANGYNIYRILGAVFNPATALKVNSSLIPKGTGRISFDDSSSNAVNRRPDNEVPLPENGQTFAYKVETEDTLTSWSDGTANVPAADTTASKTAGVGDGTGGR